MQGAYIKNVYQVSRPIYEKENFDNRFPEIQDISAAKKIKKGVDHAVKGLAQPKNYKHYSYLLLTNVLPCISWISTYQICFILNDIIAGFTVAFMHIPQGMAYVALVPLPPVYGLYTSFFPVLFYCLFGTSKHISYGTYAVTSIMLGNVVAKYTPDRDSGAADSSAMVNIGPSAPAAPIVDANQIAIQVALSITCLVGLLQLLMGVARFGFITTYMSTPIVRGFTTGASIYVLTSQLKSLFGIISLPSHEGIGNIVLTWIDFFKRIHLSNVATVGLSAFCVAILISTKLITSRFKKYIKFPIPVEFILIILGTIVSHFMNLPQYGVSIVGEIPRGMPRPQLPTPKYWIANMGQSIAIAMVAFFSSYSMAKILGEKHNYEVSSNKELIAYGISTTIGSCFSSVVASASLSRSLVQESVGGQTQLTGIISCLVMLTVILRIGPLFRSLPKAVLSAIICVALRGMFFQLKDVPKLYKRNKVDMSIFLVTFLATTFLDVDIGLAIGVIYALFSLVVQTQKPEILLLGNIPNTDFYVDLRRYPNAKPIPDTLIYSFRCFIYYANANGFRDHLYKHYKRQSALALGVCNSDDPLPIYVADYGSSQSTDSSVTKRPDHNNNNVGDTPRTLDTSLESTPVKKTSLTTNISSPDGTTNPNAIDRNDPDHGRSSGTARRIREFAKRRQAQLAKLKNAPPDDNSAAFLGRSNNLDSHGMKVLDSSHCSFTKSPRLQSASFSAGSPTSQRRSTRATSIFDRLASKRMSLRGNLVTGNDETAKQGRRRTLIPDLIRDYQNEYFSRNQDHSKVECCSPLPSPERSSTPTGIRSSTSRILSGSPVNRRGASLSPTRSEGTATAHEDNSNDLQCILTRYNSLIDEGKLGLLVEAQPPAPPQKGKQQEDALSGELPPSEDFEEQGQKGKLPLDLDHVAHKGSLVAGIKHIVLDFSYISMIDTVGIDTLSELIRDFHEVGVVIVLAECNDHVIHALKHSDFFKVFPLNRCFLTIHDAVLWIQEDMRYS